MGENKQAPTSSMAWAWSPSFYATLIIIDYNRFIFILKYVYIYIVVFIFIYIDTCMLSNMPQRERERHFDENIGLPNMNN